MFLIKCFCGGCSSVAERATVARKTRVRFSPSTLFRDSDSEMCFKGNNDNLKKEEKVIQDP